MEKKESFTPITIGIMGGSASGKTTFANALAEALADFSPIVLNQDSYFRDWSEYSEVEREHVITANSSGCRPMGCPYHRHTETACPRRYRFSHHWHPSCTTRRRKNERATKRRCHCRRTSYLLE